MTDYFQNLPRELRDQIYDYLLNSEYTRTNRSHNHITQHTTQKLIHSRPGPKAYKFHTGILGVNHEIHDQAEERLYKTHKFIAISYKWPSVNTKNNNLGLLWAPVVSSGKPALAMRHHSLQLDMSVGEDALDAWKLQYKMKKAPAGYCIVLAQDLKAFLLALGSSARTDCGTVVEVSTFPGPPPRTEVFEQGTKADGSSLRPSQLTCELRSTKHRPMAKELQHSLLAPLAQVRGPSQAVNFTGSIFDAPQVLELASTMGPSLSFQTATYWSAFVELSEVKDVADAAIKYDGVEWAVHEYKSACRSADALFMQHWQQRALCPIASNAVAVLRLELHIHLACAQLLLGERHGFSQTAVWIEGIAESWNAWNDNWTLPEGLQAMVRSIGLWFWLYAERDEDDGLSFDGGTIEEAVSFLSEYEPGRHQLHDREILLQHEEQQQQITPEHLPFLECSVSKLPFKATSHHKTISPSPPGSFKGWHDLDAIKALSTDEKQLINDLQEVQKIAITSFD